MVVVLSKAGDQVPSIPFVEVDGKGVKGLPSQIAGTGAKVGVTVVFTAMIKVVVNAHWPAAGVKV